MNNINIIINMTILENIDSDEDILEHFDIVQGISVKIEIVLFPKQVLVAKKTKPLRGSFKNLTCKDLSSKYSFWP